MLGRSVPAPLKTDVGLLTMTGAEQRRLVFIFSAVSLAFLTFAGCFFLKWGFLRVQVALGEEQTQMFEECRTKALETSDPQKIAGLIQAAMIYYPSEHWFAHGPGGRTESSPRSR